MKSKKSKYNPKMCPTYSDCWHKKTFENCMICRLVYISECLENIERCLKK